MTSVTTAPASKRRNNKPSRMPLLSNWPASELIPTREQVGWLLSIIGAIVLVGLLSGCCPAPTVIYQKAEPYPLPPTELMRDPLNMDLIPSNLMPGNARPGSTPP